MKTKKNERKLPYIVFVVILSLFILDIVFNFLTLDLVEQNKYNQIQSEQIRLNTLELLSGPIQGIDLGLRKYALTRNKELVLPIQTAIQRADTLFNNLEEGLIQMNYELSEFYMLKNSVKAYMDSSWLIKSKINEGEMLEAYRLLEMDNGNALSYQYKNFKNKLFLHVNLIDKETEKRYQKAVQNDKIIQFILLIFCLPAVGFFAYFFNKFDFVSKRLSYVKMQKANLIKERNQVLEIRVKERTKEVELHNESLQKHQLLISEQKEELERKNVELNESKYIITVQNESLERLVKERTTELKQTNNELVKQNYQLQEIAYIIAHNLRRPVANIKGLLSLLVMEFGKSSSQFLDPLVISADELDEIIVDLNKIIEIRTSDINVLVKEKVNLKPEVNKILSYLGDEIKLTNAEIDTDFSEIDSIKSYEAYTYNILYNLISNSIKYRHPDREPSIKVSTRREHEYTCLTVQDNGIGMDMKKCEKDLFKLYNRFHDHVEGRGLGLYMVNSQMNALEGRIEVQSWPETGTRFELFFKN